MDSGESVETSWSGLQGIPEQRYSVTGASGSGGSYTGSLTISPLADQDDGTYTCTVTVTGGSNVLQATASDDIIITVRGKNSICLVPSRMKTIIHLYTAITNNYKMPGFTISNDIYSYTCTAIHEHLK